MPETPHQELENAHHSPADGHISHLDARTAHEQLADQLTHEEHEALARLALSRQAEFLMEVAKAVRRRCGLTISSRKIAGILALNWWLAGENPLSKRYREFCCEMGEGQSLKTELREDLELELERFPRNKRARANTIAEAMGYSAVSRHGKMRKNGSLRSFLDEQMPDILSVLEHAGFDVQVQSLRHGVHEQVLGAA